jgi:hypothetical protein
MRIRPSGGVLLQRPRLLAELRRPTRRPFITDADIVQTIAAFERQVRDELLREAELAALGERHRRLAGEMTAARTLLPAIAADRGPASRGGRECGSGCSTMARYAATSRRASGLSQPQQPRRDAG